MITSNPIIGTGLHAIGGVSAASCYLPNTQTSKWSWGTFWLAQSLFAWIIMPFIVGIAGTVVTIWLNSEKEDRTSPDMMKSSFLIKAKFG